MPNTTPSAADVETRGEALYRQLRPAVEPGNDGRFLVIELDSGDYEIDADDLAATKRLLSRHPNGITYGVRIGHHAAYRLGHALLEVTQ